MAESFVFYRSFHEALKKLSMEQYGKMMFVINEYALNGVEPEGLEGVEEIVFMLIKPQIDANMKKRKAGSKGGRPKKIQEEETEEIKEEEKLPEEPKTEQKEEVKAEERPKVHKFIRPTVEEIKAYCKAESLNIDPQRFFDYYESKGWIVGKSPMKNWHAACRTWARNNFEGRVSLEQTDEETSNFAAFFADKTEIETA